MSQKLVLIILLLGLVSVPLYAHCGNCGHTEKKAVEQTKSDELVPQKTCPVMGSEISKDIYTEYNGSRVYFCCDYCVKEFKKNPEKYLKKLGELGEKPEVLEQENTEENKL